MKNKKVCPTCNQTIREPYTLVLNSSYVKTLKTIADQSRFEAFHRKDIQGYNKDLDRDQYTNLSHLQYFGFIEPCQVPGKRKTGWFKLTSSAEAFLLKGEKTPRWITRFDNRTIQVAPWPDYVGLDDVEDGFFGPKKHD